MSVFAITDELGKLIKIFVASAIDAYCTVLDEGDILTLMELSSYGYDRLWSSLYLPFSFFLGC